MPRSKVVLVIHGGAGVISRTKMTAERESQYREALERALRAGAAELDKNGRSLDAVEAAIKVMEDSPLFNAGKGAVFTHEGRNELDAAIMRREPEKRAGAVAGVTRIKNPIAAGAPSWNCSPHVLLVGEGADRFAISQKLEEVNPVYFWTPERWKALQETLEQEGREARQKRIVVAAAARSPVRDESGGGRARPPRQPRRRDVNRRDDEQAVWPRRRLQPIIGRRHLRRATRPAPSRAPVTARSSSSASAWRTRSLRADEVQQADGSRRPLGEVLKGLPPEDGGVGGVIAAGRRWQCRPRVRHRGHVPWHHHRGWDDRGSPSMGNDFRPVLKLN